jgi:hypothetical protein
MCPLLFSRSMLTHHRRPVCLSLVSTDLPIWSTIETAATLYQKDKERFHLLLTEPAILDWEPEPNTSEVANPLQENHPRLLWLEISPYRVIMTMQGNTKLSYRHLWETGVYGISRYWLHSESMKGTAPLRLRNYTRSLILEGQPLPTHLRVEYELWSQKVQLGRYILNLDIHH